MKTNLPGLCPVEITVNVAGGKWKPLIIYHLISGTLRFGELQRQVSGVSQRSLTLQLRELERDGILDRKVFAEVPPRVEYSLTPFGRSLEPVLNVMHSWGQDYVARSLLKTNVEDGEVE